MNHRQCIALLAASSLTLAGTAPLRASDGDGVEVRQSEDALYCKERKLGTWFYCEKPKEEPRKAAPRSRRRASALPQWDAA
jgi:conjugal transfer pilus assembly protein TraF